MIHKLLITYILFITCVFTANSQIYKYIGIENGLSSRRVLSIQQGTQDYMWILTHKGIDRYDGKNFKHYKLSFKGKDINFYPNLNQLNIDGNKTLLEFGKDGYVFKYNEIKDSFQLVFNCKEKYPILKNTPVTSTYLDSKNTIWMCCEKDIVKYYVSEDSSIHIRNAVTDKIVCMTEGNNDEFYFTTDKTIHRVKFTSGNSHVIEKINIPDIVLINYIYYHKNTDILLISTLLNGLYLYDPQNGKIHSLGNTLAEVSINTIKQYYKNPDEILIATDGDGVYKLNLKTHNLSHFLKEDYRKLNKMNGSIIKDICIDKAHNLWTVIYPTGITVYTEKYQAYEWIRHSIDNTNSLVDDRINYIMEDSDGDIWYATSNGISHYNKKNNKWNRYLSSFSSDTPNDNHIFTSLCECRPGEIAAGGYMSGIYVINKYTGKINYALESNVKKGESHDKYIRSIIRDKDNIIWYGGFYNLHSYNGSKKETSIYHSEYPITCLKERNNNSLWVGTINGLYIFDKISHEIKYFDLKDETGCINSIYQTNDNSYTFIGTYGNGLFVINNNTGEIKNHHTGNSGLITNNIYSIAPNKNGNLLLGTELGLSLFDIKENIFTNWTKEQGLMASNFNQNAAINTTDGHLIFGSNEGAVILSAEMELSREFSNIMVLDNLSIMYRKVHPEEPGSPLKKLLNETSTLELKYNQNTFSMNVSSVNYDNPSNIYYSWKLIGFFDEWSKPTEYGLIRYTNLSPGDYTLKIRAILLDNNQLLEERSIKIIVGRPFWFTIWAFIIYILLLVGAAYWLYRYKMIKKDRRISQEKINFFMHTAHDIRTPLTLIKAPLGEILKNEKLSENGLMNINLAIQNTDNLSELADKLMNFQKEELYSSHVTVSQIELGNYLSEYLKQFYNYAEQKGLNLEFEKDFESLYVWIDRNKIDSILRNLMTNALKYTHKNGTVKVTVTHNKSNWMLKISDTGIGIPKHDQKKLFKYLFRGQNATNQLITGSGIGMLLTWRLIKNHEGKISFTSTENVGTTFNLSFPIKSNKYIYKETNNQEECKSAVMIQEEMSQMPHTSIQGKAELKNAPKILIVEDNSSLRNFIIQSLSDTYRTEGAENGEEALEIINKEQPDLIISDVMMPVMNGHQLCRAVKGNVSTSHIPFIMLTALSDRKDILTGLESKADLYIVKPFDLTLLKANISNALENREFIKKRIYRMIKDLPQNILSETTNINNIKSADSDIPALSSLDEEFIKKVTDIIKDGLGKGLNVDTVCAAVNMSRTSFYNKIKALTGEAPAELIRNIRMEEAAIMLKTRKYSVSEVSDMLGFADPKYFTDTFKKYYGVPPRDYIKNIETSKQ